MGNLSCQATDICQNPCAATARRWNVAANEVEVKVDEHYLRILSQAFVETPVPSTVSVAIRDLCQHFNLDASSNLAFVEARRRMLALCRAMPVDALKDLDIAKGADGKRVVRQLLKLFSVDFEEHNLAIFSYTMDSLYSIVNTQMSTPGRLIENKLSTDIQATLPWMRMVEHSLASLPEDFKYHGTLYRVTSHVFDSLYFEQHFKKDDVFVWHSFRSASTSFDIASNPSFVPNTIFEIRNAVGVEITLLSQYPEECELLLPPGTTLQVKEARKGTGQGVDVQTKADWIVVEMLPKSYFTPGLATAPAPAPTPISAPAPAPCRTI